MRQHDPAFSEPAFCCCEFVDRHGRRAHLSDASSCDDAIKGCLSCSPPAVNLLVADLDDRLRLPMYNGAVHLGFEGALAFLAVPMLGAIASHGPLVAALVALTVPPLLAALHTSSLRRRRRSRFFVAWSAASFAFGNLLFTVRCGERLPFAGWLACAILHLVAYSSASTARYVLRQRESARRAGPETPPNESGDEAAQVPLRMDEDRELSDAAARAGGEMDDAAEAAVEGGGGGGGGGGGDDDDGTVRCGLCGRWVAGYDHHCIWIDTCIGAPNLGPFVRGLLALCAATALQAWLVGGLAWQQQLGTEGGLAWGAECVGAAYAALISLAVGALLVQIAVNLSRGLTAHQARRRRRQGQPLPAMRWELFVSGARPLMCPS